MDVKIENTCYMCDQRASTIEHVPPKAIFPEYKDIKADFRKNLITVPSCKLHNTLKSQDDEFLMISLGSQIEINSIGREHLKTKITRSVNRPQNTTYKDSLSKARSYEIHLPDGKTEMITIGIPNLDRTKKCLESIGYGLYYHTFKKKFHGEIKSLHTYLVTGVKEYDSSHTTIEQLFNLYPAEILGSNPEIFTYQFVVINEDGDVSAKLTFYEGVKIYLVYEANRLK